MIWEYFNSIVAVVITLFIISGVLIIWKPQFNRISESLFVLALLLILSFAIKLWVDLGRPPMRTMGETRLWYAIFLNFIAFVLYKKWKFSWLPLYSALVGSMFLLVNVFKPEIQSKNLIPALQSPWFIPHVSVYIISYAFIGAATLMGIVSLYRNKTVAEMSKMIIGIDKLVYIGTGMLLLGLIMGGIWAKEVWCHFWSWDPKETWAFVTLGLCMLYIHVRKTHPQALRLGLSILILAFICLMITWKGVNYLPSAKASMHTYF